MVTTQEMIKELKDKDIDIEALLEGLNNPNVIERYLKHHPEESDRIFGLDEDDKERFIQEIYKIHMKE